MGSQDIENGQGSQAEEAPAWAQEIMLRLQAVELRTREVADRTARGTPLESEPSYERDSSSGPRVQGAQEQAERLLESLHTKQRKRRLPDPERFEGRRTDFKAWTAQMWAKLSVDMGEEPDSVRFWYTHSRLGGSALNQITPWVAALVKTQPEPDKNALQGLMNQLSNAYDDPEDAERAVRKLNSLRQDKRSFGKYLATFERTLLEAGGLTWDDVVKKSMLAKGLSADIQKALVATPVPASYDAYCSLLHTVSHNLESLRTKERTEWSTRGSKKQAPAEDSTMDWEPTATVQVASTKARTKLKGKALKFRGQCYRCQKDGHMARDCPESSADEAPKKSRAASTRRTKKAPTKTQEVKDEEPSESNSESSEDSGKEEL
jgi:zinc knuckle protein/retrotransposon gag protein